MNTAKFLINHHKIHFKVNMKAACLSGVNEYKLPKNKDSPAI